MEQQSLPSGQTISVQQDFVLRRGQRMDIGRGPADERAGRSALRGPDFRAVSALIVQEPAAAADQMHPGRTAERTRKGRLHGLIQLAGAGEWASL